MKKIAVIGAGFSGLGVCYHLQQMGGDITVFDGKGVGGGASGIASGLLHSYPGETARLSWKGEEGLAATRELLKLVGLEAYKETGILRLALTEKQEKDFQERAEEREDVEWWSAEKCHAFAPGSHYLSGIFICSGITVHASLYLKGLWKVCEKQGAHFVKQNILLSDLREFDQVVLAAGGGVRAFEAGRVLDLRFNKGQVLVCQKPKYWKKESSIIGKGYLAMSEREDRCYLGSTYERDYTTEGPCLGTATDLILNQIKRFIPSIGSFKVKGCYADVRVSNRKGYHPIAQQLDENLFVLTAMGSRGLLYHSYLGKLLAKTMMEEALI